MLIEIRKKINVIDNDDEDNFIDNNHKFLNVQR